MWLSMEANFEVTLLIIPDFQLKIFYLFLCIMNITSLIKRNFKNQHKTTWRYQFTPTTMAIIKRQVSVAGDTGKLLVGTENGAATVENTGSSSKG